MNPRIWLQRFSALFQKRRLEQDLEFEIQEHLEMAIEENMRRGMSPSDAAAAARQSFGGLEPMKEELRDQRGIPVFETLARETQFAFRSLRRTPGFTFLAVVTLAMGIGANSAIFSAVNTLLFRPPGISQPGRVVVIRAKYDKLNFKNLVISFNDFKDISNSSEIFSAAAIAKTGNFTHRDGAHAERLAVLHVSWKWFEALGAPPSQGRTFTAEDDEPGNHQVVILSHAAWQRVFGGDPSIVGKTIELNRLLYQVIGVMRPEYTTNVNELGGLSGQRADLFTPLGVRESVTPYTETYLGVARLQPGISLAQARAFMSVLTSRGFQDPVAGRARKNNGWGLWMIPYSDFLGGDLKTPMLILWGAVGFVLLIACANIAGLMLARTSTRSREFAVRTALGGTRWHLLRQLVAESSLLALAGSALGLCVATVIIQAVEAFGQENVVAGLKIPFDMPMLIFTAGAGILSGALFGIAPAGQIGRFSPSEALKASARTSTAARRRIRLRSVLTTAEVALALVLSIGAGLLLRSLSRLQNVDVGFQPQDVMSAVVTLPEAQYKEPGKLLGFYRTVIQQLSSVPGAKSVAVAYPLPFGMGSESRPFQIAGRPVRPNEPIPLANVAFVTPGFFSALSIPLKRGRIFTDQDTMGRELITIVDETLAARYWPNEDPVGQRILLQGGTALTVIGIVGHIKQSDLASGLDRGAFYVSFYQDPIPFASIVVQAPGTPSSLTSSIQAALSSVDPAQAIYDAKTMQERVTASLAGRKFTVVLLGMFAVMAVFLAALGLYGVINYGVTQRTQEIGIRLAMGARPNQILSLIVGQGLRITALGIGLGLCAAFGFARMLPNQLFGVSAFDPTTFAGMAAFLTAIALFASYMPARRAMRLDPVEACRYE